MLDLDLDLEADLGIDTVKQAELFATIREAYGIARDEKLKLRDFPTLDHVLQFVRDRRPASAGGTSRPPCAHRARAGAPARRSRRRPSLRRATPPDDDVRERVLALVAEKTGYPTDMLDLDLDLEADLGIDTVKQAELFATIREAYGIPRDDKLKLRDFPTLKHVIGFVRDRRPADRPTPARAAVGPAAPAAEAAARLSFAAADAVPRRVPIPVLRPPLTLCKATGVTLGAGQPRRRHARHRRRRQGAGASGSSKLGVEVLALEGAPTCRRSCANV